jgi:pimeloyl-ACP methyl ester carboxylesterase
VLLVRQAFRGLYPLREVGHVVAETVRHPWSTYRLAREAHDLDLTDELHRVAPARIPALVVGCSSDSLTTPAVCEAIAERIGGEVRQIDGDGHMWMLSDWPTFSRILAELAA